MQEDEKVTNNTVRLWGIKKSPSVYIKSTAKQAHVMSTLEGYEPYVVCEDTLEVITLAITELEHSGANVYLWEWNDHIKKPEEFKEFVSDVFEIAFGNDAFLKGYSFAEVITVLKEFSNNALEWEQKEEIIDVTDEEIQMENDVKNGLYGETG